MKKILLIVLLAALVAGGIWLAPRAKALRGTPEEVVPAKYIATVESRDIDYSIEVAGDVAPEFQLEVKTEVGGKIRALHVVPGQVVTRGEVLCEIDDTDLKNQKASAQTTIDGAQLAVDRAENNFQRGKALFAVKLITKETYDTLESDLALAKNTWMKAERQLQTIVDQISKTKVVSPTAGTVLSVPAIEGQVVVGAASVNNGTTLMTVADLSKLLVTTNINQVDVARLQLRQAVKLTVESVKEETMDGRVTFIAPVASIKSGVKGFEVKAMIANPSPRLRPGMTVNMTVPVAHASNALSIPVAAVFKNDSDQHVVYVLGDMEKAEAREVTVGISNLEFAEIKTGVKAGDRILMVEPRLLEKKS